MECSELIKANMSLAAALKKVFVKDSKGTGTLTFEIKKETPGIFYLNGQPLNR